MKTVQALRSAPAKDPELQGLKYLGSPRYGDKLFDRANQEIKSAGGQDLSRNEFSALRRFLDTHYPVVNHPLRNAVDKPLLGQAVALLIRAVSKLPVHRGPVNRFIESHINVHHRAADEKSYDAVVERYPTGAVVAERAFTHATTESLSEVMAGPWASSGLWINQPNITFRIKSKSGRLVVPGISTYDEKEVVFLPNTRFKVIDVQRDGYQMTEIQMTEV